MEKSNDILYEIALSFIPNIGPIYAKKLIEFTGSPRAIFEEELAALSKIPGIGNKSKNLKFKKEILLKSEKEITFLINNNYKHYFYQDKNYPNRLKNCIDSPVNLFSTSKYDFNKQKIISIVGTRNATNYGLEVCNELITNLCKNNHNATIVSGLAYGIDVCSHKAALKNNLDTIAIMGTSLNTIYPALHKNIAMQIKKQGCLLTEFTTQDITDKKNFAKRNRIIAGISDATIVVESDLKGGSLITADIANSYNRDVFAFPGRSGDKNSKGCNALIKTNKAALIDSFKDLEYILGWEKSKNTISHQKQLFVELNSTQTKIIEILKNKNNLSIDFISTNLKIPISKLSFELIDLEFKGVISCLPGSLYKLI